MSSLIPNGQTEFPLVSGKAVEGLTIVSSSNNGDTWTSAILSMDYINNKFTKTLNTGDIAFVHTVDKNPTLKITDPLQIVSIDNVTVASNSASVYKYNTLIDGKIQVGNGSNGLESRVVENNLVVVGDKTIYPVTLSIGEQIFINDPSNKFNGYILEVYVTAIGGWTVDTFNGCTIQPDGTTIKYSNGTTYLKIVSAGSFLQTTPTHNTIQLDNSNSPAYKHLICKGVDSDGMIHDVAISQELAFNTGTNSYDGDGSKFTQLTNGTLIDLNGNTIGTKFSTKPTGKFKR